MSDRSAAANSEKTREDRAASDRRIYGYVDRVTGRADQREQLMALAGEVRCTRDL